MPIDHARIRLRARVWSEAATPKTREELMAVVGCTTADLAEALCYLRQRGYVAVRTSPDGQRLYVAVDPTVDRSLN